MGERLVIGPADRGNPLWTRVERYLKERLADLRARNDGPLSLEQTLELRGQIREVKSLLESAEDLPEVE